ERVPAALRGRVFGAISAGANMAMPVGVVIGGIMLDRVGLRPVYLLVAVSFLICTVAMLFNPIFHQMDKQIDKPAQEPQSAGANA
ncbi:MAG TPA: MFS transporter, partial [Thermomicrobiales bacterium]